MITTHQIAPCGMNCALCLAFQREKNNCVGCNSDHGTKPNSCKACIIKNCDEIANSTTGFCYSCSKFPCKRLKQLDKRYRTKYAMSMIENLLAIKQNGIANFIQSDTIKWACTHCGSLLCVHRPLCLSCGSENHRFIIQEKKQ